MIRFRIEVLGSLFCAVVAIGCSQGVKRISPPSINASSAGAEAIETYDTDQDGKISGSELDKCPALKSALGQFDTDGDQGISADEIATRINAWEDARVGRLSIKCAVTRNGRPLAGADVRFVPEGFLGDDITPARGNTDAKGLAVVGSEDSTGRVSRGVSPGLYRVEITKSGEDIPAQYNTETILGQEVAVDAPGVREGFKFDLTK